jgi:hypothetical protein
MNIIAHRPSWYSTAQPLILSFSQWEKGRLNDARSLQHRPLSHWERDRVRGDSLSIIQDLVIVATLFRRI